MNQSLDYDMDNAVGYLLGHVGLRLKIGLRRLFLQSDLDATPEQWAVLFRLHEQPGLTQSELGDRTVKDKTTVTRILDRLEAKGLAERRNDPQDRRCQRLFLTPAGAATLHALMPVVRNYGAAIFADFTPDDRDTLRTFLLRLENRLDGLVDAKEPA